MPTTTTYEDLRPMTLKQAGEEFFQGKASYSKLRKMAKKGELPVKLVGGRYFTRRDWLDKWFNELPQVAPANPAPKHQKAESAFGALRVIGK